MMSRVVPECVLPVPFFANVCVTRFVLYHPVMVWPSWPLFCVILVLAPVSVCEEHPWLRCPMEHPW